jgi:hypothetical protein
LLESYVQAGRLIVETIVHLHVLSQRRRVCVGLVASVNAAVVRFVGCVHMHVLFAVGAVRKSAVAAFEFALEWLFTWNEKLGFSSTLEMNVNN